MAYASRRFLNASKLLHSVRSLLPPLIKAGALWPGRKSLMAPPASRVTRMILSSVAAPSAADDGNQDAP